MTVRDILRMGDPRLLEVAVPVADPTAPEIEELIGDMFDTMQAARSVGLAAPQIGVGLQVVIFGFEKSEQYPDAPMVPLIPIRFQSNRNSGIQSVATYSTQNTLLYRMISIYF